MMQSGDAALVGPDGRRQAVPPEVHELFFWVLKVLQENETISIDTIYAGIDDPAGSKHLRLIPTIPRKATGEGRPSDRLKTGTHEHVCTQKT